MYNYCPTSLDNILLPVLNEQCGINHKLRNANQFKIPHPRTDQIEKSPFFALPTEWNSVTDIIFQHNKITFELTLTEHILSTITAGLLLLVAVLLSELSESLFFSTDVGSLGCCPWPVFPLPVCPSLPGPVAPSLPPPKHCNLFILVR